MPANLTPQYLEADRRFREARDIEEKIVALREMMALIPKHKGTDKLRADLRKKLSKLLEESRRQPKKGSRAFDYIPREGVAQVAIVGLPNSGKSSLINCLTRANTLVADYPYSTITPAVGMFDYEDIQIQMIDLPPLWDNTESWVYNLIRNCDLVLMVIESIAELKNEYSIITDLLSRSKIAITSRNSLEENQSTVKLLPCLIAISKEDLLEKNYEIKDFADSLGNSWPISLYSIKKPELLQQLKIDIFVNLNLIRVYTKKPGYPPDLDKPYVLKNKSTMQDVASAIHKDLSRAFKFAKVWSRDNAIKGMAVEKKYQVKDGDIIEFHR